MRQVAINQDVNHKLIQDWDTQQDEYERLKASAREKENERINKIKSELLLMNQSDAYFCKKCDRMVFGKKCEHRSYEIQTLTFDLLPVAEYRKLFVTEYDCWWCPDCNKQIKEQCEHNSCFRDKFYRSLRPLSENECYWCSTCNKQVRQNCFHSSFGLESCLRDLSVGRIYRCDDCRMNTEHNCGHVSFGDQSKFVRFVDTIFWCNICCRVMRNYCGHRTSSEQILDLTQRKVYWCEVCNKQVIENCRHGYFGRIEFLREFFTGKYYWCNECERHVKDNCGHFDFGKKSNERDVVDGGLFWCGGCEAFITQQCRHGCFGIKQCRCDVFDTLNQQLTDLNNQILVQEKRSTKLNELKNECLYQMMCIRQQFDDNE